VTDIAKMLVSGIVVLALAVASVPQGPPMKPPGRPAGGSAAASRKTSSSVVRGIVFEDVTARSGLNFHLICGSLDKRYIMDSMCGGVAIFDYDNDGWMDIFMVNGSTLKDLRNGVCHPSKLFRNNHDGTFTDVGDKSGLSHCGWGFGVAVGDFDNDGSEDLYVTYLDGAVLYHNNGTGTFSDVTAKAGVGNPGSWGTSAAFADYDNDGFLDLYVANYVDIDLDHLPEFGSGRFCAYRGIPVSCGPRGLKGARDRLYHNNGDGTFTDVTQRLNVDPGAYYGLGVLWLDYDKDGCTDLYVANDSTPSLLYHNDCRGGFTEVGVRAGVAYSSDGREEAGMGIDAADYDHDGWLDIAKTNFSDDANNLYHNDRNGEFTDLAGAANFGPVSIPFLGFGVKFFDADNDGWEDILIANGHVNPQVDGHSFGVTYAERPLFFRNMGGGKFSEVGRQSGAAFSKAYVGRAAAMGDFSNAGRQDILFSVLDGSPVFLRNAARETGHWIAIRTLGRKSNRDGLGARIEIKAGSLVQIQEVRFNSSFEAASDPRAHFGLGPRTRVDAIVVRWPSGIVDTLQDVQADQVLTIEEGKGAVPPSKREPRSPGTQPR